MQDLMEEARRLKGQGRLDEAIGAFKRVIDQDIDNAEAYLELGLVYFERQVYSLAAKALTVAAGLRPTSGLIHYHLGLTYHAMGDEDALRSVRGTLIIIDPEMAQKLATAIAGE